MREINLRHVLSRVADHMPKQLVLAQVRKTVESTCEELGPERLAFLIEGETSFASLIDADVDASYRKQAMQFQGWERAITDQDFWAMVPSWAQSIIVHQGEKGTAWYAATRDYIRGFFAAPGGVG